MYNKSGGKRGFSSKSIYGFLFFALIINFIQYTNIITIYSLPIPKINENYIYYFYIILLGGYIFWFANVLKGKPIPKFLMLVQLYLLYVMIISYIYKPGFNIGMIYCASLFPLTFTLSMEVLGNKKSFLKLLIIQMINICIVGIIYLIYSKDVYVNSFYTNVLAINGIYYIVLLVPYIYCIGRTTVRTLMLTLACIPILYSMKRAAVLAIAVSFLINFILESQLNPVKRHKIFKLVVLCNIIIIIFIGVYNYLKNTLGLNILARFSELAADGGSGRIDIWQRTLTEFADSNMLEIISGHGYNSVSDHFLFSAHNDFVEILFNYGLIGEILYVLICINLIRYCVKMYKFRFRYTGSFGASLGIFFIISLSSNLIFVPTYFTLMVVFWGFCIQEYNREYRDMMGER